MLKPDEKWSSLVFLLAFCLSAMLSALLLCMLPVVAQANINGLYLQCRLQLTATHVV